MERLVPAQKVRRRAIIALTLLLTSCQADPTAPIPLTLRISAAQRRWEQARIQDYVFKSSISCECLLEFATQKTVSVRRGRVVDVRDIETGVRRPLSYRQPIDSLFALLRREAASPWRVDVEFDQRLGYPRRISYGRQEVDGGGIIAIDGLVVTEFFLGATVRREKP